MAEELNVNGETDWASGPGLARLRLAHNATLVSPWYLQTVNRLGAIESNVRYITSRDEGVVT